MRKDAKIYVAGHRGLVGSAICKALESAGYENIITKVSSQLDLRDKVAVDNFFIETEPEYVFLAAAKVGGIMANNEFRADFIYDNLCIQNNVIDASYRFGVSKLLFLGSTCIYPKNCPQPMSENSLLTSELEYTNEPYAIAKIAGIKMCESYNIQHGTNFLSVMPTNLYGYNDNFHLKNSHVLPALIRKMHLGKLLEEGKINSVIENLQQDDSIEPDCSKEKVLAELKKLGLDYDGQNVRVEIWGTGTPRREFLWSDDLAEACVFIMENVNFQDLSTDKKEIRNTHINIGTGVDVSIKELSETIKGTTGFNGEIFFNPNKPDGTPVKLCDVSKLNSLGWKHKIELKEGISKLYGWYTENC